jgi:hypothetical protein
MVLVLVMFWLALDILQVVGGACANVVRTGCDGRQLIKQGRAQAHRRAGHHKSRPLLQVSAVECLLVVRVRLASRTPDTPVVEALALGLLIIVSTGLL